MTDRRQNDRRKAPAVGVGCVVIRDGQILLVRNHGGYWSTPGGHMDYGESPADCAARETFEETGVRVRDVQFIALTNDIFADREKHYVTIWMKAEAEGVQIVIGDHGEVEAADWFDVSALPSPLHLYFENLLGGKSLPPLQPGSVLLESEE